MGFHKRKERKVNGEQNRGEGKSREAFVPQRMLSGPIFTEADGSTANQGGHICHCLGVFDISAICYIPRFFSTVNFFLTERFSLASYPS
jgi:hypothetical protein